MTDRGDRPERRWVTQIAHLIFRIVRPMTMGVRALVIDGENRVFLVRHTYVPGWHLPGGGVEAGETLPQAIAKELREEANIRLTGAPQLHGMFHNSHVSPRDHVAVYVVRAFVQDGPRGADHEIAETGFFALDALPPATTRGTRARLAEVFGGVPLSETWEPVAATLGPDTKA